MEIPSLRSLVLKEISIVGDGQPPCVALDHLQHLTIDGNTHTAAFILEHIKISEDLSLHLDGLYRYDDETDWPSFLSNLLHRIDQDGSQEPFDVLSIRTTRNFSRLSPRISFTLRTKAFGSTFIQSAPDLQGLWITDPKDAKLVDSILLAFSFPESNLGSMDGPRWKTAEPSLCASISASLVAPEFN